MEEEKRNNDYIIETLGVDVYYGNSQILHDINIKVSPSTVTSLIGPSGCGKSSYLRILNRMNDYIEGFSLHGKVLVDGKDIFRETIDIERLRKNVGMVFQKPNPFPKSVFQNVAFGLKIQGTKSRSYIEDKVEVSLKKSFLWEEVKDSLKKNALTLSSGQQQRLCIARVLVTEPKIILMDEPTASLDPVSTRKIEELIFELKKDYTMVVATHNMQQAGRISDRTAFFYMGELIEDGATKDIFLNPKQKRTENYITGRIG